MSAYLSKSDSSLNAKNYSSINSNVADENNKPQPCKLTNFKNSNQGFITSLILFLMQVLNMTDRYVVSSVLIDVQIFFHVSKSVSGLLQTMFLLSYMLFSPLNGYLGDRINRKYLLILSSILWFFSILGGSFLDRSNFILFVLSRCLFGMATASFETLAVPIIGDRFFKKQKALERSLIFFNMGPPIGTGLAYLIGLLAKDLNKSDWRYSMRFTPIILFVVFIIIIICYVEPERAQNNTTNQNDNRKFSQDLKDLCRIKTYVLLAFCWTAGLTVLGAFSWWSSTIIEYSLTYHSMTDDSKDNIKKIYSILQVLFGVIGLIIPCQISNKMKKSNYLSADCYILSFGFFITSIFLYAYLVTIHLNVYISIFFYMMVIFGINMGWVLQANILLDVVRPNLRSTANALMICMLHLVGDSASPYWVGAIADYCLKKVNTENTINSLLNCTQLSFYPLVYVAFFSSTFALFASLSYPKDRLNLED